MKSTQLSIFLLFILGFIYLFILQIKAIWPFTIDDMYITLRYAKHWSQGYGLLWNIGAPPVEGYSNFSFLVLARVAYALNLNPIMVLKSAGVVGLFFTCGATFLIARFWVTAIAALIPCLWLLAYSGELLWSISGLETACFQALICFAIFFIFHGLGYTSYPQAKVAIRPLHFLIAGLLMALAGITRPETPALMLLLLFLMVMNRPIADKKVFWLGVLLFCVPLLLFYLPYFMWRWHYYGYVFPNAVYCKGISNGAYFELNKQYLKLIWPFMLLALPAILKSPDRRHYFLWLPSVLYLVLLTGADTVAAFANRLFLPAFVLLLPLSVYGLQRLNAWYLHKSNPKGDIVLLYFTAFLLAFFFIPFMSLGDYAHYSHGLQTGEVLRKKVAAWIDINTLPTSKIVLGDCGLIPFIVNRPFIDSYCLNNAEMSHYPLATMYQRFCKQIISTMPEVIILTSLIKDETITYTPADACLAAELRSNKSYRLQRSFSTVTGDSSYRYEIFTTNRVNNT